MVAVETKKESGVPVKPVAEVTAAETKSDNTGQKTAIPSQVTTGEKLYSTVKFITADVFILAATALLAYVARYGKESYVGIPNYLKKFQDSFHKKLLDNKILPLGKANKEWGERLAGAAASATILMHGGNAFILPMKWFEDNKKKIVAYFNRQFGKDGEEEAGNKRLHHEPMQTWGDVIKGRFSAWGLIFSAFVSFDFLLGKSKKNGEHDGMYYLDQYEEKFGRWLAGFTKSGKEIAKYPVRQELPATLSHNTTYRFGKILALDFFATAISVVTWDFISRVSAKKRREEHLETLRELQNTGVISTVQSSPNVVDSKNEENLDNTSLRGIIAKPPSATHVEAYANKLVTAKPLTLGA